METYDRFDKWVASLVDRGVAHRVLKDIVLDAASPNMAVAAAFLVYARRHHVHGDVNPRRILEAFPSAHKKSLLVNYAFQDPFGSKKDLQGGGDGERGTRNRGEAVIWSTPKK